MIRTFFTAGFLLLAGSLFAQSSFNYEVTLQPVNVAGLPGLHSYAFARYEEKWLIIGGRKDGLHARQPFNSFPAAQNNTDIYVVDVHTGQWWSASVNSLPVPLKEHLQSTNMNFIQQGDTLYIMGGYAYAASVNDHITFPQLTTVQVSALINGVVNSSPISNYFKYTSDTAFAVTGGRLGKIGNTFYLVGGHRFDGRYNPMNHNTFVQVYTNQLRKFSINNSGSAPVISNYSTITDGVHLHRRDYNLLPQIFPNGEEGYTISSGVFQPAVDLPFLYPVDITASGYTPQTSFNQYLSNYHSAFACLYDSVQNQMHTLFFGGISQYFYQNNTLIQDNNVPFVNTISLLTRLANGTLQEYQLPVVMPGLEGAGAEFIINHQVPHTPKDIIELSKLTADTVTIGYIYGGITSPQANPFTVNQTTVTNASPVVYAVKLVRSMATQLQPVSGTHSYNLELYPNPADSHTSAFFYTEKPVHVLCYISNAQGQLLQQQEIKAAAGRNEMIIDLRQISAGQTLQLNFVFDYKNYVTKTLVKQ